MWEYNKDQDLENQEERIRENQNALQNHALQDYVNVK